MRSCCSAAETNSTGLIGPFSGCVQRARASAPIGSPRRQVELGLVGQPDLAIVDCLVELREQRQPPRNVLEPGRIVEFPLERFGVGFVGRDQGAAEAAGQRTAAAELDAEAEHGVDAGRADPDRAAEQGVQGVEMRRERRALGREPGENPLVALVDAPILLAQSQSGDDLLDELALAGGIERRADLGVIMHPHRDQRQVAAAAVRREGGKVRQVGQRIDQTLGARPHHRQADADHAEQEQAGHDVDRDQESSH